MCESQNITNISYQKVVKVNIFFKTWNYPAISCMPNSSSKLEFSELGFLHGHQCPLQPSSGDMMKVFALLFLTQGFNKLIVVRWGKINVGLVFRFEVSVWTVSWEIFISLYVLFYFICLNKLKKL